MTTDLHRFRHLIFFLGSVPTACADAGRRARHRSGDHRAAPGARAASAPACWSSANPRCCGGRRVLRRLHDVPEVPIAVIDAVADLPRCRRGAAGAAAHREPALAEAPWGTVDARAGRLRGRILTRSRWRCAARSPGWSPRRSTRRRWPPALVPGHTELLADRARATAARRRAHDAGNDESAHGAGHHPLRAARAIDRVTFDAVLSTLHQPRVRLRWYSRDRASRWRGSIRMRARADSSAAEEIGSRRRRRRPRRGHRRAGRFPPTPSSARAPASSTWCWRTTRPGLIPVEVPGRRAENVNVTLGLPFVRTSPDHGTARRHRRPGDAPRPTAWLRRWRRCDGFPASAAG